MGDDVRTVISNCHSCVRAKASFRDPQRELHLLPIRGLGHRWDVNFAGPMPMTKRGNLYVLVMIEHFTKWVELVPLP